MIFVDNGKRGRRRGRKSDAADFASFLKTISRPIITPAKHSNSFIIILYHTASVISIVTTSARYGPNTMPAISQPRIAGNFSFDASFPQITAAHSIAKIRRNPITITSSPTCL